MRNFLLILFLFLAAMGPAKGQVNPESLDSKLLKKSFKAVLGSKGSPAWLPLELTGADREKLKPGMKLHRVLGDTLFVGKMVVNADTFYVIPDVAPSKSEIFSFLLYLDEGLEIYDVDVLKYRENYGYEIDYPLFRRQFKGKEDPKDIVFGRTIQNISGATISARSLTYAVHDLLLMARYYEPQITRKP